MSGSTGLVAVYVDEPLWEAHGRHWCHLVADTTPELHAFAARLGLLRQWFQSKPGRPWHDHYDLPEEIRPQAVACGARSLTTGEMGALQVKRRRAARAPAAAGAREHGGS
jgi:hypothetical protein